MIVIKNETNHRQEEKILTTEAVAKLKSEMSSNNNPYVQAVGQFLLQHLDQNPQNAEKISCQDKTIIKSLDEMRKVAEKKKIANCAVLTDTEGFSVVLKYFGIDGQVVVPGAPIPVVDTSKTSTSDFEVKLDDFL
jgi:hypothetical protein